MPSKLIISTPEARGLARDLDAIADGMGKRVSEIRRDAADIVAGRAARLAPVGPGPRPHRKHPDDHLPHLRDMIAGRVAGVVTTHPGGPVHEWGGTVTPWSPRQVIRIRRSAMAMKAGAREQPRIERLMQRRFDDLIAESISTTL